MYHVMLAQQIQVISILYALIVFSIAAPTAISTSRPTASSISLSDPNPQLGCHPISAYRVIPSAGDCRSAYRLFPGDLPTDPPVSEFSITSSDPRFRLPQDKSYGSCTVNVSLDPDVLLQYDVSNWRFIKQELEMLRLTCVQFAPQTGGVARMGTFGGIILDMKRTGPSLSNSTDGGGAVTAAALDATS